MDLDPSKRYFTKNDLKESLKVLMLMDKRKRLELLYIYHQLMGLTNQLIKNSNKNDNEIKLWLSGDK